MSLDVSLTTDQDCEEEFTRLVRQGDYAAAFDLYRESDPQLGDYLMSHSLVFLDAMDKWTSQGRFKNNNK